MPPGPLRGRAEPMARALPLLRSTRQHGSSGVLLITGPAGIGKTAVLTEICRQATALTFRVATGRCDPVEQVWPGAPVIALLRAGSCPLATAAEYEQITRLAGEPLVLADRLASVLESAAAGTPLLLAIDDLQWADRISRFLLRTLAARLIGLPVLLVLASRDENPGPGITGPDLVRAEHLRLAPLTTSDLLAIAQDRLGRAPDGRTRQFLDAAGGNPFLALQLIDDLGRPAAHGAPDTAPGQFTAAIAERLDALDSGTRAVAELVALAGRPLPAPDVATLLPAGPGAAQRALADAAGSGLVIADGPELTCRHDLVREAIEAAVPGERARCLHRALAGYYLAAGDPLTAAPHARAAATPGDLASAMILISAAETLMEASPDDAGQLATLAFRTVRPAQAEWLEVSLRCLSVLCQTQRPAETMAVAELILARADDAGLVGDVETKVARALWLSGGIGELISRAERVLKSGTVSPSVAARMRAARALARTRLVTGEAAARETADALASARAAGDREALALALQAAGEAAKNEALHEEALRHFRELRSLSGMSCLAEEVTELQFLDRYEHAQALLDMARSDRGSATETILPALHGAQLWLHFNLGRLDDADAAARALAELGQELGSGAHTLEACTVRIAISLLRGDVETAAGWLQRADDLVDGSDRARHPGLAVMRGWVAASRGDLPAALGTLRPVLDGGTEAYSVWPLWPCWVGLFFEMGTLAADGEFVATAVQVAETAAARNPGVASFAGVALNLRARSDDDLAAIAHSADVLARSPRPVLRAGGAESYGRALLAAGRRADGLAQLDLAWDEYHGMGAWALRAAVQQTMREAGARRAIWSTVRTAPAAGWASLTEAERRVAGLIAAGYTNKSAAAELGVSVNTVGAHLRAIFAKLGVQSRVQLTNSWHQERAS